MYEPVVKRREHFYYDIMVDINNVIHASSNYLEIVYFVKQLDLNLN